MLRYFQQRELTRVIHLFRIMRILALLVSVQNKKGGNIVKKALLFLVTALATTSMVACGNSNEDAGANENTNAAENMNTEENANAEENTDANAGAEGETYTVAVDTNYVPFGFLDIETNEMVGFDIDLIHAVADKAGFELEVEVVEFDGILAGMETGRYDIGIAGMTITEERAENFDFSDPYYDAGLIIAVSADEEEIQSEDDLGGATVATRASTTSEDYLLENTDAEVKTFPDIVNAYQDLVAGRVDAVVYDVPNVAYYIETEALGEMKTVGGTLTGEQYGIAFPQDSELREPVNEALAELMEDGTYDDIYEEWFGELPPE